MIHQRVVRWFVYGSLGLMMLAGMEGLTQQTGEKVKEVKWVWWEAESPSSTNFPDRHPFAPENQQQASILSEGKWIGIDGQYTQTPFLEYEVSVPSSGRYFFFVRKFWKHGPFRWRWDDQPYQDIPFEVALLDEVTMRKFVCANWVYAGEVQLTAGRHRLRIELTRGDGAAAFDCFLLINQIWMPRGKSKPDEKPVVQMEGWYPFSMDIDPFSSSPIDLRFLNEKVAGERGFIGVKGEQLIYTRTQEPVYFWGVNAGPGVIQLPKPFIDHLARHLAKLGVNIVRIHGKVWDDQNIRELNRTYLDQLFYFISAMKKEGIYTGLSIYFPLWVNLSASRDGFDGYNNQHPFALLFFHPEFQRIYRGWWEKLLTTPNPYTKLPLKEDPAVAFAEIVNEDSYLFWTFHYDRIPEPQMVILERLFAEWLEKKYGSLSQALAAWNNRRFHRDNPEQKRMGFLSLWEIFNQKDQRCQDTAEFLTKHQRNFFVWAKNMLQKELGFKGVVQCSNWVTADGRILGPLDKWSNLVGDYMDRHGYFSGPHKGDLAGHAISHGDLYLDETALTLPKHKSSFSIPVMDLIYNGKPSTITEICWTPPNRFRAEFPVLCALYGALQGSDGFFFFALSGASWQNVLSKFAIQTPTVMGQFPALALIYRRQLVKPAPPVVELTLNLSDLFALKGMPTSAPLNLDELRVRDIPAGKMVPQENLENLDPLAFFVGKVLIHIQETGNPGMKMVDLSKYIDRNAKMVKSITNEITWDYDKGIIMLNAPQAQGAVGFLSNSPQIKLQNCILEIQTQYASVFLVSLDNQPLQSSRRMLLQVMTEEMNNGWETQKDGKENLLRVTQLGTGPLLIRNIEGKVTLGSGGLENYRVTALDFNGYAKQSLGKTKVIQLLPDVLYYFVEKE